MSKRVPRLKFDDEEIKSPKAKKATQKADKTVDKFEKAEKKIPKKMFHEDVDKPKPSSKLTTEVKNIAIVLVIVGIFVLVTETVKDGLLVLLLAFILSPWGLPMLGAWLLSKLILLKEWIVEKVY